MKVLICGNTTWANREAIRAWLCKLQDWGFNTVIEGEARGADSIAREEAELLGMAVLKFPAQWDKYHKAAGPLRNKQMLVEGKPDLVLAFYEKEPEKGTADMIALGKKAGIRMIVEDGLSHPLFP